MAVMSKTNSAQCTRFSWIGRIQRIIVRLTTYAICKLENPFKVDSLLVV